MEIQISGYLKNDECLDEVVRDLDVTVGVENDGRPMTVKCDDEWTYRLPQVNRVLNIVRSDGTIGSIFARDSIHFQVWSKNT
ncbi:unnamed protein product [Caenorhabditis nigoni]